MGVDADGVIGGVWNGAYREEPWHGVGDSVNSKGAVVGKKVLLPDRAMTGEELLEVAGMNWEVQVRPLSDYIDADRAYKYAITYREDQNRILGTVSASYGAVQNSILGQYAEAIMKARSDARPVSAVELWGGEVLFIVLEFPELARNVRANGAGSGKLSRYMGLYTSHNGRYNVNAVYMNTLWVCQNTFTPWTAERGMSVRHTINAQSIAESAVETIESMVREQEAFDLEIDRLQGIKITPIAFARGIPKLIGKMPEVPGRALSHWENTASALRSEWGAKTGHSTAFDAVMAVQGFEQHSKPIRGNPRDVATITRLLDDKWPLTKRAVTIFGKN